MYLQDILYSGETHCVKKFVLHNNFPGHYDFGMLVFCKTFIFEIHN